MSITTPQQLAEQLQATYAHLGRIFALLDAEEVEQCKLVNGWSPKALLAHVGFWDDFQTRRMQAAIGGAAAQQGIIWPDLDNDQRATLDETRSWDAILSDADAARQRMVEFAATLEVAALDREYPEGERTLSLSALLEHMVRHTQSHRAELYAYCGSLQRWSLPELRAFLVRQHTNLMDSIGGLSETTLLNTFVCGHWSIRDVLAHVFAWNEYEYTVLQGWPKPSTEALRPWLMEQDTDLNNANLLAARANLSMIDLCDGLMTHHRRILRIFDRLDETALNSLGDPGDGGECTLSSFFYGFALHEAEHAEDIWKWKVATNR